MSAQRRLVNRSGALIARAALALVMAVGLFAISACEKKQDQPDKPADVPPPRPTTPVTPQARASEDDDDIAEPQPATTQPVKSVSVLTFGDGTTQRPENFPRARLRVSKHDGGVVALLYTDDPKAAINDDYVGNSYYLEMPLPPEIREPQQVVSAEWHYKVDSNEFSDSPYGIFLHGMGTRLQPADVVVRFTGDLMFLHVQIEGTFLQFSDPGRAPQTVMVKGTVLAGVEMKNK